MAVGGRSVIFFLFATGCAVALLAFGWKFGLEEWLDPFLPGEHLADSDAERWEFVIAATFFSIAATAIPSLFAVRLIRDRMKADRVSAAVFNSAPQPMLVADQARQILAVNPAFEELSGWTSAELVGRPTTLLRSGDHPDDFYGAIQAALDARGEWSGEISNRRRDGCRYAAALAITCVRDEQGQIIEYIGVLTDITWRKQREEQALYDATHDPLTGLANRRLFMVRLKQVISASMLSAERFAVLFLDLDGFKQVNDMHGHAVGDALLVEVAKRLSHSGRSADMTARLAGDEFVMIFRELNSRDDACVAADRVLAGLAEPLELAEQQLAIRASVGIAMYPDDGDTADELLVHADRSMYHFKARQKGAVA